MVEFFWGTAVAAYQVEGGNDEWSDWGDWKPHAGTACDFWNRSAHYLDRAKALGTNAFRFSIEWARLEPREGEWDDNALDGYRRMIEAMRGRGQEPFVTLWHFTLPKWVAARGGWTNPRTVEWFGRYVRHVAAAFGGSVRWWLVINEPSTMLSQGYLMGSWPPGRRFSFRKYFAARANLVRAVRSSATILHEANPACAVGSAFNISVVEAARAWDPGDIAAAWLVRTFNDRGFLASVAESLDFIGLNYYQKLRLRARLVPFPTVTPFVPAGADVSDLGWEIHPEGLTAILRDLDTKFAKPVVVTENGIADATDSKRPEFIRRHLEALMAAKAAGADVRGYFHWSLFDNFEWAHGFGPRFGLYEMDYERMEALPRKSAAAYRELITKYSK